MSSVFMKLGVALANMALIVTMLDVNLACFFFLHQPELPKQAERFKKYK